VLDQPHKRGKVGGSNLITELAGSRGEEGLTQLFNWVKFSSGIFHPEKRNLIPEISQKSKQSSTSLNDKSDLKKQSNGKKGGCCLVSSDRYWFNLHFSNILDCFKGPSPLKLQKTSFSVCPILVTI